MPLVALKAADRTMLASLRERTGLPTAFLIQIYEENYDRFDLKGFSVWFVKQHSRFMADLKAAIDCEFENPEFEADGEPALSTRQTAKALGFGEFHLANLRSRGRITSHQVGRRTVYTRTDLDSLLTFDVDSGKRHPLVVPFGHWLKAHAQAAA